MESEKERLVLAPAVEALLIRGLDGRLSPELKASLRELGFDLDRPLLPSYPAAHWDQAVEMLARALHPELDEGTAHFRLGERLIWGLESTYVGRAMMAFTRLVGPRRAIFRMPSTVKMGSNFIEATVKELGPAEFEIFHAPIENHPEFLRGTIVASLQCAGGRDVVVELTERDPVTKSVVLHARWAG